MMNTILWITWNPPKTAFTIPYIDLDVAWYGILFASGFLLGYLIIIPLFKDALWRSRGIPLNDPENTADATNAADKLMWYTIIGTVVGARLGHMLFYDFHMFWQDPMEIFMLRHGGLASHGGTIGVMIAIVFYLRNTRALLPGLTFVTLMDIMVIPTAVVAFCIRMGNFVNQEILGTATTVPWAVIFGHPADHHAPVPRHPAQLYEALLYLATFFILISIWMKWKGKLKAGFISGIFYILVFGGRFLIEFVKERQGGIFDESFLQVGQYLSIPFIILGIYLAFFYKAPNKENTKEST